MSSHVLLAPSGAPALSVSGLSRSFGEKVALAEVDLSVQPGQIHALLGPNGAGKTTLIRILSGLVDPDGGTVSSAGAVGLVPSGDRTFYLRISGLENLLFYGRLLGLRLRAARQRALAVLEEVGLSEAASLPVGRYSHGMQKRLSVARALLVRPAVLLVDEATHDLDPEGARRVRSLIGGLTSQNTAVLWATQRVEEIRDFADTVTFLHRGRVRFAGSVADLIASAPSRGYVVRVRNGHPDRPPQRSALEQALGAAARLGGEVRGADEFVLVPRVDGGLGSALAALAEAGFDVLECRRERAEVEEAFLALTAEAR